MYRRLLSALAEYRALAADASWRPPRFEQSLHPGDASDAVPDLARTLTMLRDLPEAAARPDAHYTGVLVDAVRRFQTRHGLDPDGVIGPRTSRALAVPPSARVRQIELTLERFRWIPDLLDARFAIVNVPAFELVVRERLDEPGEPALSMRVVVGKAGRTPTPVFIAQMHTLVFRPYWNVPRSITVNEMLPKIWRNPGYLAEQHLEIVARGGPDVLPPTLDSVEKLAVGTARLRQRPGPDNALGRVKFLLPNRYSVYLHDTPFPGIFRKSRRDFSHGCIRLEDPLGLVNWVLRDRPEWTPDAIAAAMAGTVETRVPLRDRIFVIAFYATVIVRSDGTVWFFDDLYGHDAMLERAFAAGKPVPPELRRGAAVKD
jgi:murein L,D-transpeptidase YcbB/YkuD